MPLWRFPCVAAGATIIRKSYQTPAASVQQRPAARASQHAPGQIHRTRGAAGEQQGNNHLETKTHNAVMENGHV